MDAREVLEAGEATTEERGVKKRRREEQSKDREEAKSITKVMNHEDRFSHTLPLYMSTAVLPLQISPDCVIIKCLERAGSSTWPVQIVVHPWVVPPK
jgi:hypothetical protein